MKTSLSETSQNVHESYFGIHNAKVLNGTSIQISIGQNVKMYKFCKENWKTYSHMAIPGMRKNVSTNNEWMQPEQEDFISVYGWVSFVAFCVVGMRLIFAFWASFKPFILRAYKVSKKNVNCK